MTDRKFSGADWIKSNWKVEMSPLGIAVADLLGDVYAGIYHLNYTSLKKVDWANPRWIAFNLDRSLATYDFDELTRLVVLCHDRCLRCEIKGRAPRILELTFHARAREGPHSHRHPTIESAVASVRSSYGQPDAAPPADLLTAARAYRDAEQAASVHAVACQSRGGGCDDDGHSCEVSGELWQSELSARMSFWAALQRLEQGAPATPPPPRCSSPPPGLPGPCWGGTSPGCWGGCGRFSEPGFLPRHRARNGVTNRDNHFWRF